MHRARLLPILLCLLSLPALGAEPGEPAPDTWFTIAGDPQLADQNTVQVDPTTLNGVGNRRSMRLRVNRSVTRTSWDGVPYRSYHASVLFDCTARTARYESVAYFKGPLWAGAPTQRVYPPQAEPRWMAFRAMEPNPTQRIINAACKSA